MAALVVGVPLFLRMPPWCDLTLYDVAARTVLGGGMLYRDVFDTNLPGFVWCLIGIRHVGGYSVEIVRVIDLCIVAAITGLLIRYLRRGGVDAAGCAWFTASVALWYPFTTEFSHAQRDVWMTLPLLAAVSLRVASIERGSKLDRRTLFRRCILEGVLWGIGVWFKPHVLIVALVIWLATLQGRARTTGHIPRAIRIDFLGNFAGGVAVALLGIIALLLTGTWTHLMDVFFKWNTSYLDSVWRETWNSVDRFPHMFPPWSLLNFIGLPLAVWAVARMFVWPLATLRRTVDSPRYFRCGTLAMLYLVLVAQSLGLQRNFDYVHAPETFVLLALLTMMLPRLLALCCLGVIVSTLLGLSAERWRWPDLGEYCYLHPIAQRRTRLWSDCFKTNLGPVEYRQRQQSLALSGEYGSTINTLEIGEVADWLRTQSVINGDVIAWHDAPHAVYLELNLKPSFRFMHIITTLSSERNFRRATIELGRALPRAKFVVSDVMHPMRSCTWELWSRRGEAGPDLLPPFFPSRLRQSFPYDQPAVFRSGGGHGRYIVHRVIDPNVKKYEFEWDIWEVP